MKLILWVCLSLFLTSQNSHAKISGELNLSGGQFPDKETNDALELEAKFVYKKTFSKNLAFSFTPNLHYNKFEDSNGNNFFLRTENTGFFFKKKNYFFSAGLLSHKFGLSKGLSPINFIDTFYYASPAQAASIASPTLRAMYKKKEWRTFISYFPYRFENVYPGNKSPWVPKKAPSSLVTEIDPDLLPGGVVADEAEILFPDELEFSFNNSREQNDALKNNVAAGLRYEGKKISSQLILYNGLDTNANLQPNLTLLTENLATDPVLLRLEGNQIGITPTNERISRVGFGVKYVTPIKWRVFYEGSLSKGKSNRGQQSKSRQTHTAGLEWGIPVGDTLIVGILQAYYSSSSNESKLGLVSPLNEAYILAALWNYKKLELGATLLQSKSLNIDIINTSISYGFTNNLKFSLSGSLISGDVTELLSGLVESDYINVKLSAFF